MNTLKTLILIPALVAGGLTIAGGGAQAAPLGASVGAVATETRIAQVSARRSGGFDIFASVIRALMNDGRGAGRHGHGGGGHSRRRH